MGWLLRGGLRRLVPGSRGPGRTRQHGAAARGALLFEVLEPRQMLAANLVISELMASNDNDIRDEDQERPDWIEILNAGTDAASLDGWFLTDDGQDLQKWRFPDVPLERGDRVVVFASGKDRAEPGSELHTNFKLDVGGDYLALVKPDGVTVAFQYAPQYPPQIPDVSYGLPEEVETLDFHVLGDSARVFVPTGDELGHRWTTIDFDDSGWSDGATGVGYSFRSEFADVIQTDVKAEMKRVNPSIYLRMPFQVDDIHALSSLSLSIRYNDGYVAFLNGVEVARGNAPDDVIWNSVASGKRSKTDSMIPVAVDLTPFLSVLQTGTNVLSIQGLNSSASSSRFLVAPELTGVAAGALQIAGRHYFAFPTPRGANGFGTTTAIVDTAHAPVVPGVGDDVTVTARVVSTAGDVSPVTLYYRVMFDDESTLPMADDGHHGDGAAGDGVYGVVIPAGVAAPGQMLRWRITAGDAPSRQARAPVFVDPRDPEDPLNPLRKQRYFGTVIADPSIESNLPVLHLFVEDTEASGTSAGTHGALFHNGEFYDNVEIDVTGSAIGHDGPTKSHDVFFPRDHSFLLVGEQVRMNHFEIITDYFNRSKMRIPLAYETWRTIGTPAHLSMPVRVERNGEFYATYSFIDGGKDKILERAGLDPRGAFYKFSVGFSDQSGFRKLTRRFEDNSDLEALFDGLLLSSSSDRAKFVLDNVNIPAMVNYMVGLVLVAQGDCCKKNFYLYRDTAGTGEWEQLPQDMDGTFGRGSVRDDRIYPEAVGVAAYRRENLLFEVLLNDVPGFRAMYRRRLRTLLDEFMQPPGTPAEELYFEHRIDAMAERLAPDAQLDFQKWGSWPTSPTGEVPTWEEQVAILRNEYFPRRRAFLYQSVPDLGDMNFSGTVDAQDIGAFVLGLANPAVYEAQYGVAPSVRGDINFDTVFDFDDISEFVNRVNHGPPASAILPAAQNGPPGIQFGTVEFNPVSDNQDEEFIELVNPNEVAVDLSGWRLGGGIQYAFAPGVVLPAGGTLYVSPNVNAFRARQTGPSGDQALFIQGNYSGHISARGETIELIATDGSVVATVTTPAEPSHAQEYLRISEIMYHPADPAVDSSFEDDDFEFVELVNTSDHVAINLKNVSLTRGVDFTFPPMSLAPGARVLVVRDQAAFAQRYGTDMVVAGQYGGPPTDSKLSNGGEVLRLVDADGAVIEEFAYDDSWYSLTDGGGYSLEAVDPAQTDPEVWGQKESWLPSTQLGGTPGLDRTGMVLAIGDALRANTVRVDGARIGSGEPTRLPPDAGLAAGIGPQAAEKSRFEATDARGFARRARQPALPLRAARTPVVALRSTATTPPDARSNDPADAGNIGIPTRLPHAKDRRRMTRSSPWIGEDLSGRMSHDPRWARQVDTLFGNAGQ